MVLTKRKPEVAPTPVPTPAPVPDLPGEILRVRGQIEAFIDGKVAELKASRDGQNIPVPQLHHMLTRGDDCLCRAAVNILAEQSRE